MHDQEIEFEEAVLMLKVMAETKNIATQIKIKKKWGHWIKKYKKLPENQENISGERQVMFFLIMHMKSHALLFWPMVASFFTIRLKKIKNPSDINEMMNALVVFQGIFKMKNKGLNLWIEKFMEEKSEWKGMIDSLSWLQAHIKVFLMMNDLVDPRDVDRGWLNEKKDERTSKQIQEMDQFFNKYDKKWGDAIEKEASLENQKKEMHHFMKHYQNDFKRALFSWIQSHQIKSSSSLNLLESLLKNEKKEWKLLMEKMQLEQTMENKEEDLEIKKDKKRL